jgi:UDPglucose 6-dehydrogenase
MMLPKVSVIGLGKLGLTTAACYASKGLDVVGVDVIAENVAAINRGECPIRETGLAELVAQCGPRLRATTDPAEAIASSDVTFIIVPTPSGPDGAFSNEYVADVLEVIGPALRDKAGFHIVVVTSTVMPGTMDGMVKQRLETLTGKVCGRDFGLAYNPEFIALGSIIHDFLNADMVLIGESDAHTGDALERLYRHVCDSTPSIARMNWVSAEITKLGLNCYVTTKITFANTIAQLCERVEGADPYAITRAIGHDSRVGTKYIQPGLGFGGPCFPRDNIAFIKCAGDLGMEATLSRAVVEVNDAQVGRVVGKVKNAVGPGSRVAVLGLSYKPGSHVTEASQPFEIARRLAHDGYRVRAYDPAVREAPEAVELVASVAACLDEADCCVIATAWDEFARLQRADIGARIAPEAIIDCWNLLSQPAARQPAAIEQPA